LSGADAAPEPFGLKVGAEHAEHGVKVNQLGAEVVNPFLEFADLEEDIRALGNESVRRNREAFVLLGHAAFSRCQ
jgi:hypothetical protein